LSTENSTDVLLYFAEMKQHLREMSPSIIEKAPDGLVVIDQERSIVLVNERTEFIFGYDRSEMEGQKVDILLPDDVREKHASHISAFFEKPGVREMGAGLKLKGKHKRGNEIAITIQLSPLATTQGVFAAAWIRRI
jgi:PAS domain S-box-containing protein